MAHGAEKFLTGDHDPEDAAWAGPPTRQIDYLAKVAGKQWMRVDENREKW